MSRMSSRRVLVREARSARGAPMKPSAGNWNGTLKLQLRSHRKNGLPVTGSAGILESVTRSSSPGGRRPIPSADVMSKLSMTPATLSGRKIHAIRDRLEAWPGRAASPGAQTAWPTRTPACGRGHPNPGHHPGMTTPTSASIRRRSAGGDWPSSPSPAPCQDSRPCQSGTMHSNRRQAPGTQHPEHVEKSGHVSRSRDDHADSGVITCGNSTEVVNEESTYLVSVHWTASQTTTRLDWPSTPLRSSIRHTSIIRVLRVVSQQQHRASRESAESRRHHA